MPVDHFNKVFAPVKPKFVKFVKSESATRYDIKRVKSALKYSENEDVKLYCYSGYNDEINDSNIHEITVDKYLIINSNKTEMLSLFKGILKACKKNIACYDRNIQLCIDIECEYWLDGYLCNNEFLLQTFNVEFVK